jgi:hypothetical protein
MDDFSKTPSMIQINEECIYVSESGKIQMDPGFYKTIPSKEFHFFMKNLWEKRTQGTDSKEPKDVKKIIQSMEAKLKESKEIQKDSKKYICELISNLTLRPYLMEFLRLEFSQESILFFEDSEIFKIFPTNLERIYFLKQISSTYLEMKSPLEINLPGPCKNEFLSNLKKMKEEKKIGDDLLSNIKDKLNVMIFMDSVNRFQLSNISIENKFF